VDGRLSENDKQYVITANVPEHEKDNVKVVVKDDKVVVKGHRRFQDHLDENGKKISTESYQTFHEEIPLSHPVREKYARSSWNDGVLTVVIPKA
jgi:HSP20 family protein